MLEEQCDQVYGIPKCWISSIIASLSRVVGRSRDCWPVKPVYDKTEITCCYQIALDELSAKLLISAALLR
jgi:hypothetical protein